MDGFDAAQAHYDSQLPEGRWPDCNHVVYPGVGACQCGDVVEDKAFLVPGIEPELPPNTHDPETGVELGEPWTEESIREYAHKQETGDETLPEKLMRERAERQKHKRVAIGYAYKAEGVTEEDYEQAMSYLDAHPPIGTEMHEAMEKFTEANADVIPQEKMVAAFMDQMSAQMKMLTVEMEKWGKDLQKRFGPPAPMNRAQRRAQKFKKGGRR